MLTVGSDIVRACACWHAKYRPEAFADLALRLRTGSQKAGSKSAARNARVGSFEAPHDRRIRDGR